MDESIKKLIAELCTQIGIEMEDKSITALTISSLSDSEMRSAVDHLITSSEKIGALIRAARALSE